LSYDFETGRLAKSDLNISEDSGEKFERV